MIRKFSPPIVVYDTAVHSIDPDSHRLSIICYFDISIDITALNNEKRDELKVEIARRVKRVIQYLASEGYIDPNETKWDATTGLVVGKAPKFN